MQLQLKSLPKQTIFKTKEVIAAVTADDDVQFYWLIFAVPMPSSNSPHLVNVIKHKIIHDPFNFQAFFSDSDTHSQQHNAKHYSHVHLMKLP